MKIAHIADIHWGLGYPGPNHSARFDDICHVMNWAADKIIAEKCDLVIVAGDMFRKADIALEKASREIIACTAWLRKITGAGIEIIIISGTPSHDPASVYALLQDYQMPLVSIVTEPKSFKSKEGFTIVCVPGMDRSNFVARDEYRGLPAHEVHQKMTEYITEVCQAMKQDDDRPNILVGHFTYDLADTGFQDVLMQQEAILTQEAVQGYDLVCLGHIHRPQQNGNVFYAGSPERLSFNDEHVDAGFWLHDWNGQQFASRFIDTPARVYKTVQWSETEVRLFVQDGAVNPSISGGGEIIRVHYQCSEDINKQLNRRTLEKSLYEAGAFFVAEIKGDIERMDRARDEEVTEALTPIEAVRKWAVNQDIPEGEITELVAMTAQLLE